MWRRSQRCLLTFERLLCGPATQRIPLASTQDAVQRLQRICPTAPLPRPLAASLVFSCMQQAQYREMLQVLTCQPNTQDKLSQPLSKEGKCEGEVYGVTAILDLVAHELRHILHNDHSNATNMLDKVEQSLRMTQEAGLHEATVPLLEMTAECAAFRRSTDTENDKGSALGESENAESKTNDRVSETRREQVRGAILHYIRFEPSSAARLLRALCLVSDPNSATSTNNNTTTSSTAAVCEEALETLQVVLRNAGRPLGNALTDAATSEARAVLMLADEEVNTMNESDNTSLVNEPQVIRTSAMEELLALLLQRGCSHETQAHYLRKMVQLWHTQLQYSSARWHRSTVSMIIIAYIELHRVNEALKCVQTLAEARQRPTLAAQAALLRGVRAHPSYGRGPLVNYVDQLIAYWYAPTSTTTNITMNSSGSSSKEQEVALSEALWCTAARTVGVELLLLQFHDFRQDRVRALLRSASHALDNHTAEAAETLLRDERLAPLLHYFASFIAQDSDTAVRRVFFDIPLAMSDLAQKPLLLGALLEIGRKAQQLPQVYAVCERMTMSDEHFAQLVRFLATEVSTIRSGSAMMRPGEERRAPEARLAMVRDVAQRLHKAVPEDVRVWLDLLQQ